MGRTGTLHACEQEGVAPDLMAARQGAGRRLPADRRGHAVSADLRGVREWLRRLPARPHLYGPSRWPRRRRWRCRTSSGGIGCSPTWPRWAQGSSGASRSASASTRSSATFAGAGSSGRSNWSATGRASGRSIRRRKLHARVKREAMAQGLMVYPMGGTVDGVEGDHVLLAPPFIVEAAGGRHDRRAPRRLARGRSRRCPIAAPRPRARHRKSAVVPESPASVAAGYFPLSRLGRPPIRRASTQRKDWIFVAKRFRWLALVATRCARFARPRPHPEPAAQPPCRRALQQAPNGAARGNVLRDAPPALLRTRKPRSHSLKLQRALALGLMPAIVAAGAAFAQQAPLDLRAPGRRGGKSPPRRQRPPPRPFPPPKRWRAPTPGSMRRGS